MLSTRVNVNLKVKKANSDINEMIVTVLSGTNFAHYSTLLLLSLGMLLFSGVFFNFCTNHNKSNEMWYILNKLDFEISKNGLL